MQAKLFLTFATAWLHFMLSVTPSPFANKTYHIALLAAPPAAPCILFLLFSSLSSGAT